MAIEQEGIEEFIDYSWHPSAEEFTSPLTADQWEELLGDATFSETDAAKAIKCLLDYGEPATFQQLSIRYRAAMGRYRRWLSDAARTAGERFGIPAPQKDQFGLDEWWPLLYQTRNAGKPGAGIFEMQLRPEVVEAYERIAEAERHERRAENVRQLQRIEQLERARQEERRRAAERAQASRSTSVREEQNAPVAQRELRKPQPASPVTESPSEPPARPVSDQGPTQITVRPQAATAKPERAPRREVEPEAPASDGGAQAVPSTPVKAPEAPQEPSALILAFGDFVKAVGDGHEVLVGIPDPETASTEAPDYATRYANRLTRCLALVREVEPLLTAADVARALGDKSVSRLQEVLMGTTIPEFSYVDAIAQTLYVSTRYLEADDAFEDCVPVFASFAEVWGEHAIDELERRLADVRDITIITEDARERRTLVAIRLSAFTCCLLSRASVSRARRRTESAELSSYRRLAAELESYAKEAGIAFSHQDVTTDDFEALATGTVWPGWYCG